eukprot:TRINITY_DN10451_c0_g1_i1.p1 TRINITY_DN10451_c0_g1~~TRINITY_DN10451_c0_g1_i1.p1  ORF type:complete len:339 (-),score=93.03 TRINITY_DN10451_c0_g1_i1:1102-2118(-)
MKKVSFDTGSSLLRAPGSARGAMPSSLDVTHRQLGSRSVSFDGVSRLRQKQLQPQESQPQPPSQNESEDIKMPGIREDREQNDGSATPTPTAATPLKMHDLTAIEAMERKAGGGARAQQDHDEIDLDNDELSSEDDEDLQTVVVAEDEELDEVYDEAFALVEASFARMLTAEVSGFISGRRVEWRKNPMPIFCVGVSCFVMLLAAAAVSGGIYLVTYAIKHGYMTCKTSLAAWLGVAGAAISVGTCLWCVTIFLISSWLYTGALHIVVTFSWMWFLVGNVWIYSMSPSDCDSALYYPAKYLLIVIWALGIAFLLPTATIWITNHIRRSFITRIHPKAR